MKCFLGKQFPSLFYKGERIIRIIYSPRNINPNTKGLKPNWVGFKYQAESQKYELSCNRFEIDTIKNCRSLGNKNQDPIYKRNFYGYGCTSVANILNYSEHSLKYTPDYPSNFSHCDLYDDEMSAIVNEEATDAAVRYRKEQFIKIWLAYEDSNSLKKSDIQPPD